MGYSIKKISFLIALFVACLLTGCRKNLSDNKPPPEEAKKQEEFAQPILPAYFNGRIVPKDLLKFIEGKINEYPEISQDIVDKLVKGNVSFAIQFEDYCNEKVRKEMAELRQSSSVENLSRQKQDIEVLKAQISALQRETQKVPQLEKEVLTLRQANIGIPELQQQITRLNGQIEILQRNNSALQSALQAENSRIPKLEAEIAELKKKSNSIPLLQQEINRLQDKTSVLQRESGREDANPFVATQKRMEAQQKARREKEAQIKAQKEREEKERYPGAEDSKPQGVPVLLITNWDADTPIFKITKKDVVSPEVFYYHLDVGNSKKSQVIYLMHGQYTVEITGSGWFSGRKYYVTKKELTVTEKPLINYGGKKWHGLMTTEK